METQALKRQAKRPCLREHQQESGAMYVLFARRRQGAMPILGRAEHLDLSSCSASPPSRLQVVVRSWTRNERVSPLNKVAAPFPPCPHTLPNQGKQPKSGADRQTVQEHPPNLRMPDEMRLPPGNRSGKWEQKTIHDRQNTIALFRPGLSRPPLNEESPAMLVGQHGHGEMPGHRPDESDNSGREGAEKDPPEKILLAGDCRTRLAGLIVIRRREKRVLRQGGNGIFHGFNPEAASEDVDPADAESAPPSTSAVGSARFFWSTSLSPNAA